MIYTTRRMKKSYRARTKKQIKQLQTGWRIAGDITTKLCQWTWHDKLWCTMGLVSGPWIQSTEQILCEDVNAYIVTNLPCCFIDTFTHTIIMCMVCSRDINQDWTMGIIMSLCTWFFHPAAVYY